MRDFLGTLVGKAVRLGLFFRPGGGQALPGLIVEKLFPGYVPRMLAKLPEGVIIITGTNGKTTTTKIVTELLAANDKRVLTNSTGSNLIRGFASSISQHATVTGRLNYDLAVLEVDEAAARRLSGQIAPRWVVGLNISRDQLDRYGEVDTIAAHVGAAMGKAAAGVVVNAGDPHLAKIGQRLESEDDTQVVYFGAADDLRDYFPSDYDLAAVDGRKIKTSGPKPEVELTGFAGQHATYEIAGKKYASRLKLSGQHNYLNGAAALALCGRLLPAAAPKKLVTQLAGISLAFGRGEKYRLSGGAEIELVLVKNPASFTQALSSYDAKGGSVMIAINDNIADGRDISWLWDVNFGPLAGRPVFLTSGRRAADMALRLNYDGITATHIQPDIPGALRRLQRQPGRKVILCTYTAMMQLYGIMTKKGKIIS